MRDLWDTDTAASGDQLLSQVRVGRWSYCTGFYTLRRSCPAPGTQPWSPPAPSTCLSRSWTWCTTWQVISNDLINYLNSTLSLSSTILESPLTWRSFRFPSSSFYLPEWWCRVPLWRLSGIPQHTCPHWEPDRSHFLITYKVVSAVAVFNG